MSGYSTHVETSKWGCLASPAPPKPNTRQCMYCRGHGYLPISRDEAITRFYPQRCHNCLGAGLVPG